MSESAKLPERTSVSWRHAGGRRPEGVIDCTRKARKSQHVGQHNYFANPYKIGVHGNRREVLELFRRDIERMPEAERKEWLRPLLKARGLYCACKLDDECHTDILLAFLRREFTENDSQTT